MNLTYILLIIFIGIITYLPSLFGTFVWDDEDFVNQNVYVATHQYGKFFTEQAIAGRGKLSNYYRPIQMSIYSFIHQTVGFNPTVYHAVNIAIHIAAALSLFFFLSTLTATTTSPFGWTSFAPILFLIHPLQTEAVSYISGLSDPLVALFGFLSLSLFLKSNNHPLFFPLSLLFFIFSLLSKEIGFAFFGILILLAILKKRSLMTLLPYTLTSVIYLLFHLQVINVLDMSKVWDSTPYATNIMVRIATFIQNIFLSLGLFFFPKDLHMERDLTTPIQNSFFNPYAIIFIILFLVSVIYFWKTRKNEQSSLQLFALTSFFITLLPYSGIILINGIFYEHFLYIPIAFLSFFLLLTIKQLNNVTILFILSLLLISRSYLRQYDWIDPIRFYTQTLSFAPDSLRIRNGLGMAYSDAKVYDKALATFDDVIIREPLLPNSYHNKGNIFLIQKKYNEAENMYKKALEGDSSFTFSIFALYKLYKDTKQIDKLNELIKSYPNILNSRF
ncbi:hypothetical protein HY947_05680 [Candidatus Gottesmanbacteria bacterium]|nr:hypothetical protein [Candidatus Gottesmanbacteria bacterium]